MRWQECVTPFGDKLLRTCDQRRSIRVASGGTVCIDVSSMGRLCEYQREMNWHCKLQTKYFCIHIEYSTYICVFCQRAWDNCLGAKAGLLGKSASSLALWLAERWHCEEDWCDSFVSYSNRVFHVFTSVFWQEVIVHECTGGFLRFLLTTYLPQYEWHQMLRVEGDDGVKVPCAAKDDMVTDPWLLSPVNVGWPMHRPRLYSIGLLKSKCYFEPVGASISTSGMQRMVHLFEKPALPCSCFFSAPSVI